MMKARRVTVLILLVLVLGWPMIAAHTPIHTPLAMEILIFALFGIAYNLALGYTGIISLGHAAFFGVGGYTTGMMMKFFHLPLEPSVVVGVAAATFVGFLMGFIALRKSGVYFAMITLAISQVFYYLAQMFPKVTGGNEGLSGIPNVKSLFGLQFTNNTLAQYWLIAGLVIISTYVLWRLTESPFGRVLQAIRENEQRANTCGYNTHRIKFAAFIVSSLFSGLAGSLYLVSQEFFGIENIYWTMSGHILIITLFGGAYVMLGPLVGAIVFLMMKDILSHYFENWQIITGVLFILIVLFLPQGILGSILSSFTRDKTRGPVGEVSTGNIPERQ